MRTKKIQGFTLMEILIAMAVLLVGLVGILSLFPVGLDATRKAIEDTNAALIAESVYASLRASAQRTQLISGKMKLVFFHDGIDQTENVFPLKSDKEFKEGDMRGKTFGIPNHHYGNATSDPLNPQNAGGAPTDIFLADGKTSNYIAVYTAPPSDGGDYSLLGQSYSRKSSNYKFTTIEEATDLAQLDQQQLSQYSFNIQISYPTGNPKNLYDVVIRVNRNERLIKKFYTQLMIPTLD